MPSTQAVSQQTKSTFSRTVTARVHNVSQDRKLALLRVGGVAVAISRTLEQTRLANAECQFAAWQ